ncbi:MAG: hypothetical protein HY275_00065, partial [Gemmatimonadetes bacterium]|nr:hypothetical protein [Gemmatimonadota bacterium]
MLPRRPLALAAAALVVAAACFSDSTGPRLIQRAALSVISTFANPKAVGAPVAKVRIVARRTDGSVAKDTVITYPAGADSMIVALDVPLLGGAISGIEPFNVAFQLIGTAGDTLFSGGPVALTGYATGKAPAGQGTVTVPVVYVGPGKNAKSVATVVKDTAVLFGDSITLTAIARDSLGQPLPGTLIAWTSTDTTRLKIKNKFAGLVGGGSARGIVKAVASTLTGQSDTVRVTVQPTAAIVKQITANGQSGTIGTKLPIPLTVLVQAADSGVVRSVAVNWTITSATGGALSAATTFTDSLGLAQDTLTLPGTPGPVTVRATVAGVVGSPITFTNTAVAGTPTKLAFTVNPPASVGAGVAIAPSVTVAEQDALGNTVTTASDSIVVAIGANPGGATLGGTVRAKAVNGVATFPGLVLNKTSGGYTLVATSVGVSLTSATSTPFAVSAGAPTSLVVVTDPTSTSALTAIAPPVAIAVTDALGNTVTSATNAVTVALTAGTGTAGAVLGGSTTVNAVGGIATFSGLTVDKVGVSYKLTATATGLGSITTLPFNVGPGAVASVQISVAPPSTPTSLVPFGMTVSLLDGGGNVVTTAVDTVTIGVGASPALSNLTGTVKVAAVAGVATFTNLLLDKAGGYTLTATRAGTPSATSPALTVVPGAAAQLQYQVVPSGSGAAGVALATQPVLRVTDAAGNTVTGAAGTVTAGYTGTATVTAGATATISSGIATFTAVAVGGTVGTGSLTFTDGVRSATPMPFTLNAGPASVVLADSGNVQSGNPSALLSTTLVARVTDAFTNPVPCVTVTFAVIAGGGSAGTPSALSDAAGRARTTWTLGAGLGGNQLNATATGVGAPAQFGAFAVPVGTTATWTGLTSSNWATASNWNPAAVPTAASNVFVPTGTTFAPALSAAQGVGQLTVMAGVPMSLGSFTLSAAGAVDAGTAMTGTGSIIMTGTTTLAGTGIPNLQVQGAVTLGARTTVTGLVSVTSGSLNTGGRTLVMGQLSTSGTGSFTSTTATDSLIVTGSASFTGGSSSPSAGTWVFQGTLGQSTGATAYSPTGTHTTVLAGSAAQSIVFGNPASSTFRNVTFNNPAGVNFTASSTIISGNALVQAGAVTGTSATLAGDLADAGG